MIYVILVSHESSQDLSAEQVTRFSCVKWTCNWRSLQLYWMSSELSRFLNRSDLQLHVAEDFNDPWPSQETKRSPLWKETRRVSLTASWTLFFYGRTAFSILHSPSPYWMGSCPPPPPPPPPPLHHSLLGESHRLHPYCPVPILWLAFCQHLSQHLSELQRTNNESIYTWNKLQSKTPDPAADDGGAPS